MHKTKEGSFIHDIQPPRVSPNPNARQQDKILNPRKRTQGKNLINTRIYPKKKSPTIPRSSGKIPTKAQGQEQNLRGGERGEHQNYEPHEVE